MMVVISYSIPRPSVCTLKKVLPIHVRLLHTFTIFWVVFGGSRYCMEIWYCHIYNIWLVVWNFFYVSIYWE